MLSMTEHAIQRSKFNDLKIKYEMLEQKVAHGCTDVICANCDSIKAKILVGENIGCHADDAHSASVPCDSCGVPIHCGDVFYESIAGWGVACSIRCIKDALSFVMVYRPKGAKIFDPPKTVIIESRNSGDAEEVFEHAYDEDELLWVVEGDNVVDAINAWLNGGEA